jgi:hypothetical protein
MAVVTPEAGVAPRHWRGPGIDEKSCLPAGIVGLPGRAAHSIALHLDRGRDAFVLVVLDEKNAALMILGPYPEEDAVAEWRALGRSTGLALKIQLSNGSVATVYPQIGRILLGPTRQRRRHGLLAHRRPRFLTRRKPARFPARPRVYREREISAQGER